MSIVNQSMTKSIFVRNVPQGSRLCSIWFCIQDVLLKLKHLQPKHQLYDKTGFGGFPLEITPAIFMYGHFRVDKSAAIPVE